MKNQEYKEHVLGRKIVHILNQIEDFDKLYNQDQSKVPRVLIEEHSSSESASLSISISYRDQ